MARPFSIIRHNIQHNATSDGLPGFGSYNPVPHIQNNLLLLVQNSTIGQVRPDDLEYVEVDCT